MSPYKYRYRGPNQKQPSPLIDRANRTFRNEVYDSIRERDHAALLDSLKKAPDPKERVTAWSRRAVVPYNVNGKHICNSFIDFHVIFADGHIEYHEVKGRATESWRLKERLFRALYPERILKVIK